jgi:hypothetical protein
MAYEVDIFKYMYMYIQCQHVIMYPPCVFIAVVALNSVCTTFVYLFYIYMYYILGCSCDFIRLFSYESNYEKKI